MFFLFLPLRDRFRLSFWRPLISASELKLGPTRMQSRARSSASRILRVAQNLVVVERTKPLNQG